MEATRQHALLSYILEGLTPEEQQRALVAFASVAQGDPNTLPVQLALFMKGVLRSLEVAAKSLRETGDEKSEEVQKQHEKALREVQRQLYAAEGFSKELGEELKAVTLTLQRISQDLKSLPASIEAMKRYQEDISFRSKKTIEAIEVSQKKSNQMGFIVMLSAVIAFTLGILLDEWLLFTHAGFFREHSGVMFLGLPLLAGVGIGALLGWKFNNN